MPGKQPVTVETVIPNDVRSSAMWSEARAHLPPAGTYWLATVRPDGRPHVMPVLAVWVADTLHFVASPVSRKARNLALRSDCVITTSAPALDLVIEGDAAKVTDASTLRHVADAYADAYGWEVEVRDGAFHAEGAPTAGPPPYEVYAVSPATAFAFGTDDSFGATRYRF